jgi:type IV pilus assembly protein PilO
MTAVMDDEIQPSGGLTIGGIAVGGQTLGIAIGVIGLVGAGLIFLNLVQPLLDSIGIARTQIEQKKQSISTKQQEAARKQEVEQKITEAKNRREAVLALLPSQENIDTLILDINARLQELGEPLIVSPVANISGSAFRSRLDDFSPSTVTEPTPDRPFRTREYRLTISATYEDTLEFMRRLERLRPLLVVKDLNLKKSTVQIDAENLTPEQKNYVVATLPPLITSNFNLIAYIPLSPEELAQLQAQASQQAGGGAAQPPR